MGNKQSSKSTELQHEYDVSKWMEEIQDDICDSTLKDLAIPGSHNSGCYRMASAIASPWTACQSHDIANQLQFGIRYFDLRFGYFAGCAEDEFRVMHHHWSSRVYLEEVLSSFVQFLEKNTKEILILHFRHLYYFTPQAHVKFRERLLNSLGHMALPRSCGLDTKLSQLWENNYRVLITTEGDELHEKLWHENSICSRWFDKASVDKLKECCVQELARKHDGLWVLQTILTPQRSRPMSVKVFAKLLNSQANAWLREWASNTNIVILDFIDSAVFASILIEANTRKRALTMVQYC